MGTHNDVITYCWTEFDRMGVSSPIPNTTVTPYEILPSKIPNASDFQEGDEILISLGWSQDPPTIARFFRAGYQWVPLPPEVQATGTMLDLFEALFAFDPVQFAHFDPATVSITNALRDVQSIQSAPRTFGIPLPDTTSLIPFGDLAQLHFDYWGNTDLRAAVFRSTATDATFNVLGIADVTMPVLGTNPFTDPMGFLSGPLAELMPQMIPCQKDDQTIQYVLARGPIVGGAIAAPPSRQPTDAPIVVYAVDLPRIELDGWSKQTLAPLMVGGSSTRASSISFRITLPTTSVKTTIEILRAGQVYYAETQTIGQFLIPGLHLWTWDGYDKNGVLDTTALKENTLTARVTTEDTQGRVAWSETELGIGCEKVRWLDARVDQKKKHVDCTVFGKYSNPSEVDLASFGTSIPSILGSVLGPLGMPSLPSMPALPQLPSLPGGASLPEMPSMGDMTSELTIPKAFDLDPLLFAAFKTQCMTAISSFWSRDLKAHSYHWGFAAEVTTTGGHAAKTADNRSLTIDGAQWTFTTSCQERSTDFLHTFLMKPAPEGLKELGIGDGGKLPSGMLSRSVNLSTLMEGLPILDVWEEGNPKYNAIVGAHEVGHSVLRDSNNVIWSLTHKGTSNVAQKTTTTNKMSDQKGEIDVMLYWAGGGVDYDPKNKTTYGKQVPLFYSNGDPVLEPDGSQCDTAFFCDDFFERVTAVEEDCRGLLSMAKVTFG